MTFIVEYRSVYYVESTNLEKKINPIAISPTFYNIHNGSFWEQRCDWKNTARGDHLFYKTVSPHGPESKKGDEKVIVNDPPREFTLFARDNEERIKFTFLTVELFKQKVASNPNTYDPPAFKSVQEVQDYYLKTEFPYL